MILKTEKNAQFEMNTINKGNFKGNKTLSPMPNNHHFICLNDLFTEKVYHLNISLVTNLFKKLKYQDRKKELLHRHSFWMN